MERTSPRSDGCSQIAEVLSRAMFRSKAVIDIDSILVLSLYGQKGKKHLHRTHRMQTLAKVCAIDEDTRALVSTTYEEGKDGLVFSNPKKYIENANTMGEKLHRENSQLRRSGTDGKALIGWCIAAYSMVVNPAAKVKLTCIGMGPKDTLGFAIHAKKFIKQDERIHELIGLMPSDNRTKNSQLSTIKPHPDQNQSPRSERVLFGPIRFLNHICRDFNAEFIAITGTSAFTIAAVRDIDEGEEILVDYGQEWFADEIDGCPCSVCKPIQPKRKRPADEKDEATKTAEIAEKKRLKRRRREENKKQGQRQQQRPAGGT